MAEAENSGSVSEKGASAAKPIFREKSLDRIGSSKDLHAYLKGSGRTTWLSLIAIILILAAVLVWAMLASPEDLIEILAG